MLNEDVVKNINKLNNEKDNINLELSKKANKEHKHNVSDIEGLTIVANAEDINYTNASKEDIENSKQALDTLFTDIEANKKSILDIENLKEVDNIKCNTDTGEYTIENSKKGYLTNFNIQGKTLVNLANPNNVYTTDGVRYNNPFRYIESGKTYTFVNLCDKQIKYTYGGIGDITIPPYSNVLYTIPNTNITVSEIICYGHTSDGWEETDTDKQKISKAMLVLEGDYTSEDIEYFEGFQSVGQGDKIEILTTEINTPNLIKSDYIYTQGKYNRFSGGYLDTDDKHYACEEFIEVKGNTEYVFYGLNGNRQYYDLNKNFIQDISPPEKHFQLTGNSSWRYWVEKTPSNAHFIKVTLHVDNLINGKAMLFEGNKFDKKVIPYTLRSLPNGVKDEIVYKNNKYYLIKRCEEHTYTDIGNLDLAYTYNNTLLFMGILNPPAIVDSLDISYVLCNNFKGKSGNDLNNEDNDGCSTNSAAAISFKILKSKLTTQDKNGFNEWIKNNPITIIYQLAEPKEIELGTLNLEQYDTQTKFICNSDTVIPNISFESTQNLGSHIEVIRNNIKSINSMQSKNVIIDLSNKLLNGWKRTVSDNDGFIISKNGNQISFHMRITGGATTDSTALLKLPNGFVPKTFYVFPIFTTQNNQLVQGFMYFNFANGHLQITQLGSNVDVYSYGTYFIE
ncbi:TPA: hypothetical protein SOL27_001289 [Clostridioides difficile]|nr:hypothetical protein [Clostridioides difficile]